LITVKQQKKIKNNIENSISMVKAVVHILFKDGKIDISDFHLS